MGGCCGRQTGCYAPGACCAQGGCCGPCSCCGTPPCCTTGGCCDGTCHCPASCCKCCQSDCCKPCKCDCCKPDACDCCNCCNPGFACEACNICLQCSKKACCCAAGAACQCLACCSSCCTDPEIAPAPPSFPGWITARYEFYSSWNRETAFTVSGGLLVAYPTGPEDILAIVEWADKHKWRVRPTGQRHNWSPLTIGPNTPAKANIVILDNRMYLNKMLGIDKKAKTATCQPGMMLGDFMTNLCRADLSLPHIPAPYDLTMGGVLAIDGHGAAIHSPGENIAANNYGTLSNRIIAMTIIAHDGVSYAIRKITNKDAEFSALQTAIGRTLMVDVTLQCIDNYYLRCRSTTQIPMDVLCAKPVEGQPPARKSLARYVEKFGRAEIIWFPFTTTPWLKVWSVTTPEGPGCKEYPQEYSREVYESCQYPFADHVPTFASILIYGAIGVNQNPANFTHYVNERNQYADAVKKDWCGCAKSFCKDVVCGCCCKTVRPASFPSQDDEDLYGQQDDAMRAVIAASIGMAGDALAGGAMTPQLTEEFHQVMSSVSQWGLQDTKTWDIWGPAMNTLLYCRSSTAAITANGYCVLIARKDLQLALWLYFDLFEGLVRDFKKVGRYPTNMPVELRVSGLDHGEAVGNRDPPLLSAMTTQGVPSHFDTALWIDNICFPGTPHGHEFYAQLEAGLMRIYQQPTIDAMLRCEWSKGWAYTADKGPYTDEAFKNYVRRGYPNWNSAIATFDKLDPKKIFSNDCWDAFMTTVDPATGAAVAVAAPAVAAPAAVVAAPAAAAPSAVSEPATSQ